MKTFLTILLIAFTGLVVNASTRIQFLMSHTDNTVWTFTNIVPSPENASQIPDMVGPVGTNAPSYDGHVYTINSQNNTLLVDGHLVGTVLWGVNIVDVSFHNGFCIVNGQGYLATQYNDGDPTIYLFRLNLATAEAIFVDTIGPVSPTYSVSGLTGQQF